jgi:hypothetical protein
MPNGNFQFNDDVFVWQAIVYKKLRIVISKAQACQFFEGTDHQP